ncbi:MAG: membrane protein insertion efficiency factor YidD [Alphaproteobacteria bacterium]|nr:membrane protein insertion efficiency factor YidD [Alphaproteobacteria bacterium]
MHYRIDAPISGVEQTKYFHDDLALSRTLPNFKATTNIGDVNVYKRTEYDNQIELQRNNPATSCESNPNSYGNSDISSREARLAPKISAGGYSIPVQIADVIIQFHQKILSPVDGPRSHYRPTSSRYMQLAMYKHGFIKGFIMGCDRLLRENKAPWVYRSIEIDGQKYKYDPVRK